MRRMMIPWLMAWIAALVLCVSSAQAALVTDPFPLLVHPNMSQFQNQNMGHQICPIVMYNASDYYQTLANHKEYGLIKRMVLCVQGLVIPATYQIMYQNSMYYFYGPIAAACTLAIALWGFLVVAGKSSAVVRDSFTIMVKLGAVSMFTFILGQSSIFPQGLFPILLQVIDSLCGIVTTYIGYSTTLPCSAALAPDDIWGRVDCTLNMLLGAVFQPMGLYAGVLGFFMSAFLSGVGGFFVAIIGFAIIFFLIFSIIRAAYITIVAYVAIALMSIISPIFITLVLFESTKARFEKWVKLMIGFIMQPVFVFAYLAMMLAAFDTVIYDGRYSVYRALLAETDIGTYPSSLPDTGAGNGFDIGQWMLSHRMYDQTQVAATGVGLNPRKDAQVNTGETGVLGDIGKRELPESDYKERSIKGSLANVLTKMSARDVYSVEVPVNKIAWQTLALKKANVTYASICPVQPCTPAQQATLDNHVLQYFIQLFLSLFIALLTIYLFYLMLDSLPFIGKGVLDPGAASLFTVDRFAKAQKMAISLLKGGK